LSLEWKTVELKSIANVTMGQSPKSEFYNDNFEGMPFLQGNKTFGDKYPSFELYTTSIKKVAEKNSVLMSVRAPVGDLNIAQEDICIGRGVCGLQMKKGDNEFLYYLLKANISYLINKESGTVFGSINKNDIETFEVTLPKSSDDQMKILTILKNIDKKIDICKNLNRNLFNIASSIQTEWMINFTPFKSEKFKSSSFGLIPENWNVGKLADVIELLDSKRIPLSGQQRENMEKIYPYYGAASLMDYVEDYIFDGVYLLMGEDGTVIDNKGFPILQYVWGKFWVNNHAHILKGKNGFNVESLYLLLSKTNIQSIVTGAVQAKVNQTNLKSIEIIIPPVEVMEKFNALIKPFFDSIRSNNDEIKKLQKLRDTLLPKLMSGEIDVSKINCDMQQISTNNWDNKFTVPLQNNLIKVIS